MKKSKARDVLVVIAVLLIAAVLPPVIPARAAGAILVNLNTDTDTNDGNCSLREAIIAANTDAAYNGCAGGSGTDTISFAANYTITLTGELPGIFSPVIIDGNGPANTIIQASTCNPVTLPAGCTPAAYRVFGVGDIGQLTLNDLTVRHGNVTDWGGAIMTGSGQITINNSVLSGNRAANAGGAIFSYGTTTVTGSSILGNDSDVDGGAFFIYPGGTLTMETSTLSGNTAAYGAGISNNGTVTIRGSQISGNIASGAGGGIYNNAERVVSITGSTISGNQAGQSGAGIINHGILTIGQSTISGNDSGHYGAGVYSTGALTVTRSTIASNDSGQAGGGIYSYPGATLAVRNTTISGNTAFTGGGGIASAGTTTLTNTTISGNGAPQGGGFYNTPGATLNYSNTIIGNSTEGEECFNDGSIGANVNNIVEDGTCSAALSGDPQLGPLASNGGPTQTHALLPGSIAIDAGNPGTCSNAPISGKDQRSQVRPSDGDHDGSAVCDIGAYESHNIVRISTGSQDGWTLESGENSNTGGIANSAGTYFVIGDDAADRQYRAILSFDTAGVPAGAVVIGGVLKIKRQGLPVGSDPFLTHGPLKIDMKKPFFGGTVNLAVGDFNALAGKTGVSAFKKKALGGWYSAFLTPAAYSYINRNGKTQFRLRFALDDNDDLEADYTRFFSGDATTAGSRPRLWVEYYVP